MTIVLVILAIVIVVALLWLWAIAPQLPRADFSAFQKYDYAHRGLHDKDKGVPENSLKAFDLAVRGGFGMEFDLQLTKDGLVVVHHDLTIKRTCGVDRNINEMTYEELSGYRLFGTEERVPLFTEVLQLVGGRTPLIIELKSYDRQEELCQKTVDLLKGYSGLYCVESFDPRIVRWFRQHQPQVVRGQLMCRRPQENMSALADFVGRNLMTNFYTRPNFEAYDFRTRSNGSLKAARRVFGMQEVSWTLRSLEDYRVAKNDGCLCIFEKFLPLETSSQKKVTFADLLAEAKTAAVCLRSQEPQGKESHS
ncbi:MAG: glycerophosphodiester phosphodiesterase family protein [Acutalibacter sp.]|jgi:glycerophosphoryl diester phosphodiesterase